jgi:hypothetical protein
VFSLETEVVENAWAGSYGSPLSPSAAKGWSSATAATESADHASWTRAKIPLQIRYDRVYEPYALPLHDDPELVEQRLITSKSISKNGGRAGYRGLLQVASGAVNASRRSSATR